MTIAFCIGNGESRKDLDINFLKSYGKVYGCNAIHRDFKVDYLICCDKRMVEEALYADYSGDIYTRPDWYTTFHTPQVKRLNKFPWSQENKWEQEFHWGSGMHSVNLACVNKASIIVILGHDFDNSSTLNNIYKNTNNYSKHTDPNVSPNFWQKQFEILFVNYPQITFIFCKPDISDWYIKNTWNNIPNVLFQSTGDMLNDLHIT